MGFFSVFKDKSKRNKTETPTVNAHYTRLGRRTAFVRYVCLLVVVLFAIYSLSFHSNEITIENFRYMIKFINLGENADAPMGSHIAFDGSEGNRGMIFKSDLAVLNESGLTITGWDGEIILRSTFSYDHPKMEENGINLFCYDLGGKELRIFNSYSLLSEMSFDYPIYWLAASADGGFAVATSAKSYRSAVYVYDKEFRQVYSGVFGSRYVDFVDISDDGEEVVIASHYSEKGNLVTQVSKYSIHSEDSVFDEKFIGEIPLGIYYTENGFSLITSDKMRLYNAENDVTAEVDFQGRNLLSGRFFGSRALVTYRLEGLSGGTEAVIYRPDGSIEYTKNFDSSITDAVICGDRLYSLMPGTLTVCGISDTEETTYSIPTSYSVLVPDGDRVILFSENQAEYFDSNNFNTEEQ